LVKAEETIAQRLNVFLLFAFPVEALKFPKCPKSVPKRPKKGVFWQNSKDNFFSSKHNSAFLGQKSGKKYPSYLYYLKVIFTKNQKVMFTKTPFLSKVSHKITTHFGQKNKVCL
jgi:hypothetical protein